MSRNSDKLNIIDENTYKKLQNRQNTTSARPLRSSKYKNKHKNDREQCTLLDFVVTRTKQATKKKQPRWPIMKNLMEHRGLLPTPKRKGKTRLVPKPKVTPLKRKIKKYRIWKQTKRQEVQTQNTEQEKISETNIEQQQLKQELVILSETQPSTALLVDQVQYGLKELVLDEAKQPNATRVTPHLNHSRRFRNYCDNCTLPALATLTDQLLRDLDRFQKRAYGANPIKARAHLRFVVGFRQANCQLRINKVKLLIIATDCETCPGEGGLENTINDLKAKCQSQNVPYCFPFARRQLAYTLFKRAQVSCVAVLDYDGANETFKQLLEAIVEARTKYNELTEA